MKYTQTTLDKIEGVAEEAGYIVRYERGSFQSGFCILEDRKVVVLNKFLPLEGRINTMIDLIPQLRVDAEALTAESKKWFSEIMGRYRAAQEELNFKADSEGSGGTQAEEDSEAKEGSEPQSE
ncbi:hypothetical protein [Flaviaesturariibacter aridisoli]|uniref:hypothetical protein n=1 Tax=Flaviaesturariibacter aridisoli TaxID=2545761 RepID=UPI001AA00820|nr:hypothetical protein [Flaviaesturariibacter aridisoli]